MKNVFTIVLLVFGSFCAADYNESQKAALKKSSIACEKQLDISADSHIIQQFPYGKLSAKDALSRKYIACVQLEMGFIDKNGKINAENIIDFMVPYYDRQAVAEVTNACIGSEEGSLEDKASNFYNCFFTQKIFEL